MSLQWVKQQLLRGGVAPSAHRRAPRRDPRRSRSLSVNLVGETPSPTTVTPKSSAYIIGERMEWNGCRCLLVARRRGSITAADTSGESSNGGASPHAGCSTSRRRVTLPGITPGTVLRTRSSVVEWVRQAKQLPPLKEYSVVMKNGKPVPHLATASPLPTLPCGLAASNACSLCPWMALEGSDASAKIKHACWEEHVRMAQRHKHMSQAPSRGDALHTYTFLKPFTVRVSPNRLQGLQLFFVAGEQQVQTGVPSTTAIPRGGARVTVEREGASVSFSKYLTGSSHEERTLKTAYTSVAPPTSEIDAPAVVERDCLLETLEQKRLVPALQRWAAQLPTSTQRHLLGAFISQPSPSNPPTSLLKSHTANGSLQVVVVVHRNDEVLGIESPLCNPSHPKDLLSTEEQQLVDAVSGAAPLIAEVEVLVSILGARVLNRGTDTMPEVAVHALYPSLCRDSSLDELRCEQRGPQHTLESDGTFGMKPRAARWGTPVRCSCPSLQTDLTTYIAPYHAALSAVPQLWLHSFSQPYNRVTGNRFVVPAIAPLREVHTAAWVKERAVVAAPSAHALESIPTFWRFPLALDAVCSVLFTVLLEDPVLHESSSGVGSLEAHAPPGPLPSSYTGSSSPEVGALAGQVVLEAALSALVREANSLVALTGEPTGAERLSRRSSENAQTLLPACRLFLSVRSTDSTSTTEAAVKAVQSACTTRPTRLCLYQCTSTMDLRLLSECVVTVVNRVQKHALSVSVSTGVVDTDPLSSSFVGYACLVVKETRGDSSTRKER